MTFKGQGQSDATAMCINALNLSILLFFHSVSASIQTSIPELYAFKGRQKFGSNINMFVHSDLEQYIWN